MPTPRQLEAVYRQQRLAAQGDFVVHEVVECLSEGEEGFGEEDLQEEAQGEVSVVELCTSKEGEESEEEEGEEETIADRLEKMALHVAPQEKTSVSLSNLTDEEQSIFLRAVAGGSKTANKKNGSKKSQVVEENNSCGRGAGTRPS
jgi:hypothetical protein